jgi:hypothetical protein
MWYFVICFVPYGEKQRRYIKILMVPLKMKKLTFSVPPLPIFCQIKNKANKVFPY